MFLLRSETNPATRKELEELIKKAIDHGEWTKTLIEDKKKGMGSMKERSETQQIMGLKLLGQNYMEAYRFYWDMGEYYFNLVSKNKGILPAAKACYIIAGENLNTVTFIVY